MYKNLLNFSARVDFQAALLAVVISLCTAFAISWYYHITTHEIIRKKYEDRATRIITAVEDYMPELSIALINSKDDMQTPEYIEAQKTLQEIKEFFDALYLFTAGVNEEGEYIYFVDGLPPTQEDFRAPGDLIEIEIIPELERAFNNEIVYPEEVKVTSWGNIFISYFPFHAKNSDEVIGVVAIEFEADDLYRQYTHLKRLALLVAICSCLIAILLSSYIFKRMANPRIKDGDFTDPVTLMKNRNAYNMDMHTIEKREDYRDRGLILFEVKISNAGRHEYDTCINQIGEIIFSHSNGNISPYHINTTDFIILTSSLDTDAMEKFCHTISEEISSHKLLPANDLDISYAFALYDEREDIDLNDTRRRADRRLYRIQLTKRAEYNA